MTPARGTMAYIAPEVFSRNFRKVSYKSDVYSFGMVGGRKISRVAEDNTSEIYYFKMVGRKRSDVLQKIASKPKRRMNLELEAIAELD